MAKFLFGLLVLGGLAAAVALVPVRGRTVLDRWRAARSPVEFVERGLAEAKVALGLSKRPAHPQARTTGRAAPRPGRSGAPAEELSDRDRAAVDRIVAEHAR